MTRNNNVTMSSRSQSRSTRHQRSTKAIVGKISRVRTTQALEHDHTQFVCNALRVWKPMVLQILKNCAEIMDDNDAKLPDFNITSSENRLSFRTSSNTFKSCSVNWSWRKISINFTYILCTLTSHYYTLHYIYVHCTLTVHIKNNKTENKTRKHTSLFTIKRCSRFSNLLPGLNLKSYLIFWQPKVYHIGWKYRYSEHVFRASRYMVIIMTMILYWTHPIHTNSEVWAMPAYEYWYLGNKGWKSEKFGKNRAYDGEIDAWDVIEG